MPKTVKEIVSGMGDILRTRLYSVVGYMLEFGCLNFTEWDELLKTCTKEQITVCRYLVEEARATYDEYH